MEPVLDIHLAPKIGFVVWNTGADANTMDKASQPLPAMMTNSTPTSLVQVRTRFTLEDSLVDRQISTVMMMMIATAMGSSSTEPAGKRKKLESCVRAQHT